VNPKDRATHKTPVGVRVRLGLALAVALLPVLILSAVQADLEFQRESREQSAALVAAAERSTATAKARIESAQVLLETLASGSVGFECAQRLAEVASRVEGYDNLIRFDAAGRVVCASASTPADPARASHPWFQQLAHGAQLVVARDTGVTNSSQPSVLAATPARDASGHFAGAMAAVIELASLRPDNADGLLPSGAEVAVTDSAGRYLSVTDPSKFPSALAGPAAAGAQPSRLWIQSDRRRQSRIYAAAPLVGGEVFVVLSAPNAGLASWAWLNPMTALAIPIVAFSLALLAVMIVAERGVVRWIAYLQRIAALYARGRLAVRPVRAERAPAEIRDLAETLGDMAAAIAARDEALIGHIAQKDAMLREIHHRVKNNLQVISSLLNLQQRALTDPAARAAVSDTRQRIGALALIYRALYQSPDLKRVDLHDFLEELIGQVVSGEIGMGPAVRTELDCEPLVIDPDLLAPLSLFAVEAISNAHKHGLEEGGRLTVGFAVHGAEAELCISDTGRAGREPAMGPGVGRTLMTAFARQLRGEAVFTANPGGGLSARLVFPAPENRADPATEAPPSEAAGRTAERLSRAADR
jgi:two-component sensor histidine kinase